MMSLGSEALLAAGYAAFLIVTALLLDLTARHSHRRSDRYRTAGFTYHGDLDLWECPEGEHLRRHETDHRLRVARYRARASVCNACPSKEACTDSDEGREIARALDPWPHSEAGRFHRGICVALLGLAALVVVIALVRNHDPAETLLLGVMLAVTCTVLVRAAEAFYATPTGFPASGSAA